MKKFIQAISFLGLALIFGGVSANAQSSTTRVDADIPFDFAVGDKLFSAGKYVLRIHRTPAGAKSVEIRNENREIVFLGFAMETGDRAAQATEIKFDRSAGVAALTSIVTERGGYTLPESARSTLLALRKKAAMENVSN